MDTGIGDGSAIEASAPTPCNPVTVLAADRLVVTAGKRSCPRGGQGVRAVGAILALKARAVAGEAGQDTTARLGGGLDALRYDRCGSRFRTEFAWDVGMP
jgi:hypothetical protein